MSFYCMLTLDSYKLLYACFISFSIPTRKNKNINVSLKYYIYINSDSCQWFTDSFIVSMIALVLLFVINCLAMQVLYCTKNWTLLTDKTYILWSNYKTLCLTSMCIFVFFFFQYVSFDLRLPITPLVHSTFFCFRLVKEIYIIMLNFKQFWNISSRTGIMYESTQSWWQPPTFSFGGLVLEFSQYSLSNLRTDLIKYSPQKMQFRKV